MTALTLSLSSLAHNYAILGAQLRPTTRVIAVVKANAYGLGSIPLARKLVRLGVDYLAVAYASEGIELRKAGIQCRILVFYPQLENMPSLVEHCLEPALYSRESWVAFSNIIKQRNIPNYPIHIKFNTGLHRIGFAPTEKEWVMEELSRSPFTLQSVYSHLAATEETRPHTAMDSQWQQFSEIKAYFDNLSPPPFYHLLNTSGVFNYPEWQLDAVRVGIGLYGFANRESWNRQLQPIAQLTASITQVHTIEKGHSVGYNNGWIAPTQSRIATLPLGHADGISRQFGHGKGTVYINKQAAPIIGNICMDMLMVDVTKIDCATGDIAVFFNQKYAITDWAKAGNTITYEFLTGLGPRIPRYIEF